MPPQRQFPTRLVLQDSIRGHTPGTSWLCRWGSRRGIGKRDNDLIQTWFNVSAKIRKCGLSWAITAGAESGTCDRNTVLPTASFVSGNQFLTLVNVGRATFWCQEDRLNGCCERRGKVEKSSDKDAVLQKVQHALRSYFRFRYV